MSCGNCIFLISQGVVGDSNPPKGTKNANLLAQGAGDWKAPEGVTWVGAFAPSKFCRVSMEQRNVVLRVSMILTIALKRTKCKRGCTLSSNCHVAVATDSTGYGIR